MSKDKNLTMFQKKGDIILIDGVGEDDNGGRDVDDNMGGYGGQRRERGGHGQQTGDGVCRAELEGEARRVNQRGGQKAAASRQKELAGIRDPAVSVQFVQGGGVEGNQGHGGTLHGEQFSGHGELACGERERVKQLSGQSDD